MNPDGRYMAIKTLVETGKITMFEEIFYTFPKTKLAKDIGWHSERMEDFISGVDIMKVETMDKIADLFDLDYSLVSKIVHTQYVQKIKGRPKKTKKANKTNKRKKDKDQ